MSRFAVEAVGPAHAPVLAGIHASAFDRGWTADSFVDLLAVPGTAALLAAAAPDDPAGFILYRHAGGEAEILTVAVRPDLRRRGIAAALFAAVRAALPAPVGEIFIEVAESNGPGRALYRTLGFETVGRRKGYYALADGCEDAIVMRLSLS